MNTRFASLLVLVMVAALLPAAAWAKKAQPLRFQVHFNEGAVVFTPGGTTLQVSASGAPSSPDMVLSYGSDWEFKTVGSAYLLRLKTWQGFYWRVEQRPNGTMPVFLVTGSYAQGNGSRKPLCVRATVLNPSGNIRLSFRGRRVDPYLVYEPKSKTTQITFAGCVVSYASDWTIKQVRPYEYHMQETFWKNSPFYWKVDTDVRRVWKVENGTFGRGGGTALPLRYRVTVTYPSLHALRPLRHIGASAVKLRPPKSFRVNFTDVSLVLTPRLSMQLTVPGAPGQPGKVLSYCNDWAVKALGNNQYNLRLKSWEGFYWLLNMNTKMLFMVQRVRGIPKRSLITREITVLQPSGNIKMTMRRNVNPYLIYTLRTKSIQIAAKGCVLSYGGDWNVKSLNLFNYHLRHDFAQTFFWHANLAKKQVSEVYGGSFGGSGGTPHLMNHKVSLHYK